MNLFNPRGQKNLGLGPSVSQYQNQNQRNDENVDPTERSVDKIRSIFNDEGGKRRIRNEEL